ncbi:hypothetical protein DEF23_00870 [Marinitenerispora sediminis]|nr:hypothetical protein DEF28_05430 [Marinitenerispora sediminis]RCV61922.1 hypothetical protein DEF23_00870 [Marinitenerispora sediminis]
MSEFSPETRASDADRDRVARRLQEHFAQGRLDSDDFNERLTRVYRARTGAELERITEDLPERDLADLRPAPRRPAGRSPGRRRGVLREPIVQIPWLIWGGVNTLCFTIWLITVVTGAHGGYPWWIWVMAPWGIVMLFATIGIAAVRRSDVPDGRD